MKKFISIFITCCCLMASAPVRADDRATPQDVYDLVIKAYNVIKILGEEGLPAFNDPKGEFVYKDTYVFVLQCPEYCVAHPFALDQLKGKDLRDLYPFHNKFCEGGKNSNGTWVAYEWPRPGSDMPARKISFTIGVEGTPYTVVAGIYNDDADLEELNAKLK